MGGEYGAAMVYISEIAGKEHRVFYTGLLQCTVDAGLLLALSLVMVLQATLTTCEFGGTGARGIVFEGRDGVGSRGCAPCGAAAVLEVLHPAGGTRFSLFACWRISLFASWRKRSRLHPHHACPCACARPADEMDIWGWRIPFFLAFFTALLGFWLRRGMPEPHAFLEAARRERQRPSSVFSKRQLTLLGEGAEWEAAPGGAGEGGDSAARDADSVEAAKRCVHARQGQGQGLGHASWVACRE